MTFNEESCDIPSGCPSQRCNRSYAWRIDACRVTLRTPHCSRRCSSNTEVMVMKPFTLRNLHKVFCSHHSQINPASVISVVWKGNIRSQCNQTNQQHRKLGQWHKWDTAPPHASISVPEMLLPRTPTIVALSDTMQVHCNLCPATSYTMSFLRGLRNWIESQYVVSSCPSR